VFIPELGTLVGGKYRLLSLLGAGGMGTIYEAENTVTLKRAAVKWLHPQYHERGRGVRSLVYEARATSRIRHDNVVDVYDVVEEGSAVFLVMELLHGEPLTCQLARVDWPVHEMITVLLAAMRGVVAAHAVDVVHRDIKPDNIFLAREPGYASLVPKVIDFGISKMVEPDSANTTGAGVTLGTPKYVSYEQLLGTPTVDARTDVYAFGVILYEALTGCPPYSEAQTFAEQAVRFATEVPLAPRALNADIPLALANLVERAIAKDRELRVSSMSEFVEALEPFADAACYPTPLLSRAPGNAQPAMRTSELPSAASDGSADSAQLPRAVGPDLTGGEAPRATPIRRSLPAGPRGKRVVRVAVGLLFLFMLIAALGRRESGDESTLEVRHPVALGSADAAATRAPVDVGASPSTPSAGTTERSASSEGVRLDGPDASSAHAPVPVPITRQRTTHKRVERRVSPVPGPLPSTSGPRAALDAGLSEAKDRHRAGQVRRDEF
jgi:serine/threonine-protein kinase